MADLLGAIPTDGERVHAKHLELPGALCQTAPSHGGPLVTLHLQYVTCRNCLRGLARDQRNGLLSDWYVVTDADRAMLERVNEERRAAAGQRMHATSSAGRVHAPSARWLGASECGVYFRPGAVLISNELSEVTCGRCKRVLAKRAEREARRG